MYDSFDERQQASRGLTVSRQQEYLADARGAEPTRNLKTRQAPCKNQYCVRDDHIIPNRYYMPLCC